MEVLTRGRLRCSACGWVPGTERCRYPGPQPERWTVAASGPYPGLLSSDMPSKVRDNRAMTWKTARRKTEFRWPVWAASLKGHGEHEG